MQLEEKNDNKRILFICPYPRGGAPGQRFRYEHFFSYLEEQNIPFDIAPFLDEKTNKILYQKGKQVKKILGVLKGFLGRIRLLFEIPNYEYVFIFREATPLGPPIIEWFIARVLNKKIIYDFDDAIWLPFTSKTNRITNQLKFTSKVKSICKWSFKISCGNQYLADFASQFNDSVYIFPTVVDTVKTHNKIQNQITSQVNIGWTGSHSTLIYLDELIVALSALEKKYNFKFFVIADKNPRLPLTCFQFVKWKKETEIEDLLKFHIGLMPLIANPWSEGKCGFKAIQYLSLGIPAIVTPVGVNCEIVQNGVNGFHCNTSEDWYTALEKLIIDTKLREMMGKKGRVLIEKKYSVNSLKLEFLNLFSINTSSVFEEI